MNGGKTPARALALAVAVSVAATLGTLPLIAFNFQNIPTLGIPATVLALPALPILLATSGLAALAGLVNPSVGQVIGWGAWVPLEYVIRLVHLISQVPGTPSRCLPLVASWCGPTTECWPP